MCVFTYSKTPNQKYNCGMPWFPKNSSTKTINCDYTLTACESKKVILIKKFFLVHCRTVKFFPCYFIYKNTFSNIFQL